MGFHRAVHTGLHEHQPAVPRPLLVTLALKVNSLMGIQQAPSSLALVAGTGALLAMFANPIFGRMSDRTS